MHSDLLVFVDPDVIRDKLAVGKDPLRLLLKWEAEALEQGWDVDFYISRKFNSALKRDALKEQAHATEHRGHIVRLTQAAGKARTDAGSTG